jgi:hypothetical protein
MICLCRVKTGSRVNQNHTSHSIDADAGLRVLRRKTAEVTNTHRIHFIYVSCLYKSYPRMHDMPRATMVLRKWIGLN